MKVLALLLILSLTTSLYAQNIPMPSGMTCEGSQFPDGTYLPRGQRGIVVINGVKYECIGCGDCTPVDTGGSTLYIPPAGQRPEQQMQLMIMQNILQPVINAMFNPGAYAPSGPSQEELRRQQEELLRRQTQERQERLNMWISIRSTYSSSQKDRDRRLSSLLSVDHSYPPKSDPLEQALCAAYFSRLAEDAVKGIYDQKRFADGFEAAQFFGRQIDNLIQGLPLDEDCSPPDELLQSFNKNEINELNKRYTEVAKAYRAIMPKINELQAITIKLDETRKKKEEAEQKIKEIDLKIAELKSLSQNAPDPKRKAESDDLLAKAMALRQEAETEYQKSLEIEKDLTKEKERIEKELDKIKEQFAAQDRK